MSLLRELPQLEHLLQNLAICFRNLSAYAQEAEEELTSQLELLGSDPGPGSDFDDPTFLPPLGGSRWPEEDEDDAYFRSLFDGEEDDDQI